jgi:hypothetical protein
MTDAMLEARLQRRLQLRARGYLPIPCFGKAPAPKSWQQLTVISVEMLRLWGMSWPSAESTGCLTRWMPTIDLEILNEEAVVAVEEFISARYEERGPILVRIGRPPKRAIPFRTNTPFKKITAPLIAPNGITDEKIELLCDGQQIIVDGTHPQTGKCYSWHGGVPWDVAHADLPYLHEQEAHVLIADVVGVLADYGYRHPLTRSIATGRGGKGQDIIPPLNGEDRWREHFESVLRGHSFHDPLVRLAAMLAATGMERGCALHLLGAWLQLSEAPHDTRWEARYRALPAAIDSAFAKYSKR